jgi:hypothetical protein
LALPTVKAFCGDTAREFDLDDFRNRVEKRQFDNAVTPRPDGIVKITDFGIARISSRTVNKTGFSMGTPACMSPVSRDAARVSGAPA